MFDNQIAESAARPAKMTVYVGNLTMAATEAELRQAFAPFGQVVAVTILNDDYIGNKHPKVYAFVGMADKDEGKAAVAGLDGKVMGGQVLSVISALPVSFRKK